MNIRVENSGHEADFGGFDGVVLIQKDGKFKKMIFERGIFGTRQPTLPWKDILRVHVKKHGGISGFGGERSLLQNSISMHLVINNYNSIELYTIPIEINIKYYLYHKK